MLRSQVREEVFKILFRLPFTAQEDMREQIEEIDNRLSDNCDGWRIERVGKAELAIMRIAVYEILYEAEVPNSVAINEAVELAKRYCDESAKGFVNAVLGKIEKGTGC